MAVLTPAEYDERYFDGGSAAYTHNAGYTKYQKWFIRSTRFLPSLDESTGEYFGDIAKGMNLRNNIVGKDVLEIGCAKGFLVEGMRSIGINGFGINVSPYAIGQANPSIAAYLEVADARIKVPTYARNQWDYIITRWFLSCMSDADLTALIPELNRVARNQIHIVYPLIRPDYYNAKTLAQWAALPFARGTILINNDDIDGYVTV